MLTYAVTMPISDVPIGKWLDRTGAEISISSMFGLFHVTVSWKKVRSYIDDDSHSEHWTLTRSDKDFAKALDLACRAAIEEEAQGSGGKISPEGA